MKKINTILACVAVGIIGLASCSRVADYTTTSFASFNSSSTEVYENAGTITIPVTIYPNGGATSTDVSFTVTNGTAIQGENFTVSPANGILSFAEGETSKDITLNVVNREGIFDGNLNFTITLTGATNDFVVSGVTSYSFTIADLDHPLAAILGTWTGEASDNWSQSATFNVLVEAVEDDDTYTKVTVSDICPIMTSYGFSHTFDATVDENFNIYIKDGSWIYTGYYYMSLYGSDSENLVLTYDADAKTLTNAQHFGSRSSSGWYELWVKGTVVLSKN